MTEYIYWGLTAWAVIGVLAAWFVTKHSKFNPDMSNWQLALVVFLSGPAIWAIAVLILLMAVLGVVT